MGAPAQINAQRYGYAKIRISHTGAFIPILCNPFFTEIYEFRKSSFDSLPVSQFYVQHN